MHVACGYFFPMGLLSHDCVFDRNSLHIIQLCSVVATKPRSKRECGTVHGSLGKDVFLLPFYLVNVNNTDYIEKCIACN